MLPVIDLDFAALCGMDGADFFGLDRARIVAHTHVFDAARLPTIGTVDYHLRRQLARGLARRPLKSPLLLCYAATTSVVLLHVGARRAARLSWLATSPGWLESGASRVTPQAAPYAWWNGTELTRLHPLPDGESPRSPRVEDFGNPFGLVSEKVPRAHWNRLRADIWQTDYSPVPMEETETFSDGLSLKHAYFRVAGEAW